MNEFIIFANGQDKIGLVSSLSKKITNSGSNINESRMIKLGDQFEILAFASDALTAQNDFLLLNSQKNSIKLHKD